MLFNEENKVANGIMSIAFELNERKVFESIVVDYYPGSLYRRIEVNYEQVDFNSNTNVLSKNLMSNILSRGELVSTYKNYTVYDHRQDK